jgi:hypothetical protein
MPLYLYGELPPQQEEELEEHVHVCAACRRALENQRSLHEALDRRGLESPSLLLAECRRDLFRSTGPGGEAVSSGWRSWVESFWAGWRIPTTVRPMGAVALVALGFFSARLTMKESSVAMLPRSAGMEPVVSTIRSVQPDFKGGVQILLDETQRKQISGKLSDDQIERMLLTAARDEGNAGLRVESIELLKAMPASDEIRGALIHALTHDPNPGVRLKALDGLKGMAAHPEVRRTLAQVLQRDENAGVRIQAIDLLVQHRDDALVGLLQNLVRKEDNNYVRLKCKNALEEMNASVGTF